LGIRFAAAPFFVACALFGSSAVAQVQRISVASDGTEANGASSGPSVTADGRYVVFVSTATNLTAAQSGIHLHDRAIRQTTFVGTGALSRISADGRNVIFYPHSGGIAVYDRSNGSTTVLSERGWPATVTDDIRYVAFNVGGGDPVGCEKGIDILDRQTGQTTRAVSNACSGDSLLSPDGRYLAYTGCIGCVVPRGGTVILDRSSGTSVTVSGGFPKAFTADSRYLLFEYSAYDAASGASFVPDQNAGRIAVSRNSRFVSYQKTEYIANLSAVFQVWVLDQQTGLRRRISSSLSGAIGNGNSTVSAVSDEGTVVFESVASDLTANDTNGVSDIFAGCALFLSSSSQFFGTAGGTGTIAFSSTSACAWSASSTVSWVAVSAGGGVSTGAGSVGYTVQSNAGSSARTGTITLAGQIFTVTQAGTGDTDADGLSDAWEAQFGIDPLASTDGNGASGDPDGDGRTNAQELTDGTHPRGFATRYFAEGATSAFFDVQLALANPGTTGANVLLRFLKSNQTVTTHYVHVPAMGRRTVSARDLPGLATAEFSTVIESDVTVVADRTMRWDPSGYGSHAETSVVDPATTWYLAEGATHSGFNLFYLVQNPNPSAAMVEVRYLLTGGAAPIVRTYTVPGNSRYTIWVNQEGGFLASAEISAVITATQPVIVERAMYLDSGGRLFGAGHAGAAVTAPATEWFLAEGATGPYFDLFILLANPTATAATVTATYLLPTGQTVVKPYNVAANSRLTIGVDQEHPLLADTTVSTTLTATTPIIAERTMWWPGTAATWQEAHVSVGASQTGTRWAVAEGELGGAAGVETYILIANTSAATGTARVTLLFEDGTTAARTFALTASSRFSVNVAADFPSAVGRRFGAVIESTGATPARIVVERAMYSNAGGIVWAAGTNALATRLD